MSHTLPANHKPYRGYWERLVESNTQRVAECIDEFNHLKVAEYTPIIELKPYNVSILRDRIVATGAASVTTENTEYKITSGAGESISFQSANWGRYLPGLVAEPGMGVRIPNAPTGSTVYKWGYFYEDTGIYFQWDATGWYVVVEDKGTILAKIEQANWNDTIDGNGPSGFVISPDKGMICQFPFLWYGYGPINFEVLATVNNERSRLVNLYSVVVADRLSISSPNLPINFSIEGAGEAYVGGRQFGVYGNYIPQYRMIGLSHTKTSVGTTFTPMISFKQSLTNNDLREVAIKLGAVSLLSIEDIEWKVVVGNTLTGANFTTLSDIPDGEYSTLWDTSATAYSNGIVLSGGFIGAGVGNTAGSIEQNLPNFDMPKDKNVTLLVRTLSGTATVNGRFSCQEEM